MIVHRSPAEQPAGNELDHAESLAQKQRCGEQNHANITRRDEKPVRLGVPPANAPALPSLTGELRGGALPGAPTAMFDTVVSTPFASGVPSLASSSGNSSGNGKSHATRTPGFPYASVLDDLCERVETSGFYTPKSSPWFLRGVLEKHRDRDREQMGRSGPDRFLTRGLTDALVDRLLEGDGRRGPLEPQGDPCLVVARSLVGADPSGYLPAMAASLSDKVGGAAAAATTSQTPSTTTTVEAAIHPPAIPPGMLRWWISLVADPSTPLEIHDRLSDALLGVVLGHRAGCRTQQQQQQQQEQQNRSQQQQQQQPLPDSEPDHNPCGCDPPCRLAADTLACLISAERDPWDHPRTLVPKRDPPPSSAYDALVRRASFGIRFLSRCGTRADRGKGAANGTTKETLGREGLPVVVRSSGAVEWLAEVLDTGFGGVLSLEARRFETKRRQQQQQPPPQPQKGDGDVIRVHHRFRLLDVLLEECGRHREAGSGPFFLEGLAGEDKRAFSGFVAETSRCLVEKWRRHLLSPHQEKGGRWGPSASPSNEIGPGKGALFCAARFLRVLSRLLPLLSQEPLGCGAGGRDSPLVSSCETMDEATFRDGKALFARMLGDEETPLQQLKLVRLLVDEFYNARSKADTFRACPSTRGWLSSPALLGPVLRQCEEDPFLLRSDAARWYVGAYGREKPGARGSLRTRPLRAAPDCLPAGTEGHRGRQPWEARTTLRSPLVLMRNLGAAWDRRGTCPGNGGTLPEQRENYELFGGDDDETTGSGGEGSRWEPCYQAAD
ncbi:unnamed protein product [Pseudo-nitzschia multistriata]|uniref:Uncharacterized protein n=1 Tax=Pseudo-nitzschia multistriata TaxID=183589 RepID=A0A448Z943_9STRA|nr:unnamed protein product [Pseudo-nitzschia multistriata]